VSELTAAGALGLHGLHWLARLALRTRSPLRAKSVVDRVARILPPLRDVEDARAAVGALFPAGSCLSRALAIAAMLPGAEVVIGVAALRSASLSAHAWLRIDNVDIDTNPKSSTELPAELARLSPRPRLAEPPS
jgi:hypothetical protein